MHVLLVTLINIKARNYHGTRVIFDNYPMEKLLKKATQELNRGNKPPIRGFKVDDTTKIKNARTFLDSTTTRDSNSLSCNNKKKQLVNCAQGSIITATHQIILLYKSGNITATSQKEADTLMIAHAVNAARIYHSYLQSRH